MSEGTVGWKTSLCLQLGIDLPIVQAPMAGGWTTPALVAAVCNAGGLGMLAAARLSLEELHEQIEAVRRLTSRPFGVNFLLAPPDAPPSHIDAMQQALDVGRSKLGLARASRSLQLPASQMAAQFDLVCRAKVPIVSFAMGDPGPWVQRAKANGAFVMAMATTVDDAIRLQSSGVDAVVAQGSEAGGHRSSIEMPSDAEPPLVGLMALVPQVVDSVRVPVIAAGGIMDGRGVLAALALGAQAAQLGTRFLLATESGSFNAYRQRLVEAIETDTVVTRALTARGTCPAQRVGSDRRKCGCGGPRMAVSGAGCGGRVPCRHCGRRRGMGAAASGAGPAARSRDGVSRGDHGVAEEGSRAGAAAPDSTRLGRALWARQRRHAAESETVPWRRRWRLSA
jgi:nitronate monooxygenase